MLFRGVCTTAHEAISGLEALTLALENDSHNKAVNTKDTSHNDGDERLEDELVLEDTDGGDTDTGLGSTVGSAQVAENESSGDTHETEEGVLVRVIN